MRVRAIYTCWIAALVSLSSVARADENASPPEDRACFDAAVAGQKARKAGKLIEARADFLRCAQAACPGEVTAHCTEWMTEADEAMPSVLVAAQDERGADVSSGVVRVDGDPHPEVLEGKALPLEPGTHVIRFEVTGRSPVEQSIVLREHEKNRRVTLRLAALPARRTPIAPFILGGVGVAAGLAFGALGTVGVLDRQSSHCDTGCTPGDFGRVRAELLAADISLATAAVFVVAAVIDYLIERPKSAARASGSLPLGLRF